MISSIVNPRLMDISASECTGSVIFRFEDDHEGQIHLRFGSFGHAGVFFNSIFDELEAQAKATRPEAAENAPKPA